MKADVFVPSLRVFMPRQVSVSIKWNFVAEGTRERCLHGHECTLLSSLDRKLSNLTKASFKSILLLTVIYLPALAMQVSYIHLLENASLSFQYLGHHRYLHKHMKKPHFKVTTVLQLSSILFLLCS